MCRRLPGMIASSCVATSSRSGQGVVQAFTDWRELIRSVEGLRSGRDHYAARPALRDRARMHPRRAALPARKAADSRPRRDQRPRLPRRGAAGQPVHDLARAAPFDRRRGGQGARRQAHPVDGDPAGTRTCTNGIQVSNGSGKRAASACSTPASTPSPSRPRSSPAGCSCKSAELSVPENAQTPIAADIVFSSPEAEGPLTASLDWRRDAKARNGRSRSRLSKAHPSALRTAGRGSSSTAQPQEDSGIGEYPDIYRQFVDLIDERRSLVDVAPFRLVADCLLIGSRRTVDPVYG